MGRVATAETSDPSHSTVIQTSGTGKQRSFVSFAGLCISSTFGRFTSLLSSRSFQNPDLRNPFLILPCITQHSHIFYLLLHHEIFDRIFFRLFVRDVGLDRANKTNT